MVKLESRKSGRVGQVIVVGSGMAGVAAALQARAEGAQVTLVEKRGPHDFGGNTRVSGGAFLAPSSATPQAQEEFIESLVKSTLGRGSANLFRVIASHVVDDLHWLGSMGAVFLPAYACAPPHRASVYPLAPGQFVGMPMLMQNLRDAVERAGVVVGWHSTVQDLLRDASGAISGVVVRRRSGEEHLHGDAVVFAGGGYSGNRALLRSKVGPEMDQVSLRGVEGLMGECSQQQSPVHRDAAHRRAASHEHERRRALLLPGGRYLGNTESAA